MGTVLLNIIVVFVIAFLICVIGFVFAVCIKNKYDKKQIKKFEWAFKFLEQNGYEIVYMNWNSCFCKFDENYNLINFILLNELKKMSKRTICRKYGDKQ